MLKELKEKALTHGMSLLNSPTLIRVMENEKVGEILGKAMNIPIQLSSELASQRDKLTHFMQVASLSEVDELKRTIARLEDEISVLKRDKSNDA
ncbi:MAG: hypothetical protein M0R76_08790 [Proteobacteria bacterium]|jgi:hypothetical protein|nr:hypothetical protein [Pseudomonadota bacterium]NLN62191.1 hypothetical protein [Myxococcales bacterium]